MFVDSQGLYAPQRMLNRLPPEQGLFLMSNWCMKAIHGNSVLWAALIFWLAVDLVLRLMAEHAIDVQRRVAR